jgi:hypothetical protein
VTAHAPNSTNPSGFVHRSVRWIFLNRRTGHLTVVQWPNVSLSVVIVVSIAVHIVRPMGGLESVARGLVDVALFVWAIDELLRGVNPFRRVLGLMVISATSLTLALGVQ